MLADLEIRDLRIIERAALNCHPGGNLITGANGSGKTTLLEAISLLSTGRSFRSRHAYPLIRTGLPEAFVRARFHGQGGAMGERTVFCAPGHRRLSSDGQPTGLAVAARGLPLVVLATDTPAALVESATGRRRLLFWLMFHVEPRFPDTWQQYRRTLEQRNASLMRDDRSAAAWNATLARLGEDLARYAAAALVEWEIAWSQCAGALGLAPLVGSLQPGWEGGTLAGALESSEEQDRRRRFTTVGPHRLDLRLSQNGQPLAPYASGGHIKLAAAAMVIAQAQVIQQRHGRSIVGLIDDLPAALDRTRTQAVWDLLHQTRIQWFVTAPTTDWDVGSWAMRFHVKQGQLADGPAST